MSMNNCGHELLIRLEMRGQIHLGERKWPASIHVASRFARVNCLAKPKVTCDVFVFLRSFPSRPVLSCLVSSSSTLPVGGSSIASMLARLMQTSNLFMKTAQVWLAKFTCEVPSSNFGAAKFGCAKFEFLPAKIRRQIYELAISDAEWFA